MPDFRNRIVETRIVTASELAQNAANFRRHPEPQAKAVRGLLNEVGIVAPLIAYHSEREGGALTLIDGHMRQEIGGEWPVTILNVSDQEADLILASLDYTTSLAELDSAALADLLGRVQMTPVEDDGVRELLAQLAAAHVVEPKRDVDAEPQVDRAAELQQVWQTELGQIWQLGDHRLACGDCTDAAVVERLMGGERADMVFTDPPYGVGYEGGRNPDSNTPREKLKGDETGDLYLPALKSLKSICADGAPMYVWFAASVGKPVYDAVDAIGYTVRAMIVWNKLDAHYGNFMAQYMQKHEPCLYIVDGNASWIGPTNEVTVWDVKQPTVNEHHPTQKPVELAARAIGNHRADIVADFFLGSGSTLIAAEQLGRKCRAVEISPGYTAVCLQRFLDSTGIEPRLLEAQCVSLE